VGDVSQLLVDPLVWRSAGRVVERAAEDVQTARAAGGAALPPDAFGLMCSPLLLPPYLVVAGLVDVVLGSVAEGLRKTATNLDAAAASFEQNEQQAADAVARAVCSLGGVW